MQRSAEVLDRELDEALEMTFPASDPLAVVAPGSTRADAPPKTHDEPEEDAAQVPSRAESRNRPRR